MSAPTDPTPFNSMLVANRGEIARRVMRTARDVGLRCIAVYVDADADAPFVDDADEAVRLPGSYLDAAAIIDAARQCGADAVHPGYGFLSENADFARAVIDAGLVWVGPAPEVIATMGDKLAAKRAAVAAGVPTLPSSDDPTAGDDVGFPLLVKAAAGGGGKGMRIVERAADLADEVAAAQREALGAFGDDRVFLERYVPRARHIEIQILGDRHGGLVHLGERECSIQRRHQKIIEESPSPAVDEAMRAAMGAAALRLADAIGYSSTGTVEFLVDDASGEFYFLEVNTRLQVEHPVTEAVSGIDLVREQLRIAAGEPLGYTQDSVALSGHAIEARLYAEDPAAGYLPATGTLSAFAPAAEPVVRWDAGVRAGSVIGLSFDPMLAKVIAHAPTRAEAAGKLARALERLHIGGVTTNRDLLAVIARDPAFLAGDTTTDYLERIQPRPVIERADDALDHAAIIAALWLQGSNRAQAPVLAHMPSGFRIGRLPAERVELDVAGTRRRVEYSRRRDGTFAVTVTVPDPVDPAAESATGAATSLEDAARVEEWTPGSLAVTIGSRRIRSQVTADASRLWVQLADGTVSIEIVPRFVPAVTAAPTGSLVAPMPGVVIAVRCAPGDAVEAGQVLVVLEAMKMEHHVRAGADGVVAELRVAEGEQVDNGAILLVLDADDGAAGPAEGAPT